MKSIRTKLWAGMMVFAASVIMLIFLFQIVFLENFYSKIEMNEVQKTSELIVEETAKLATLDEISNTRPLVDMIEKFSFQKQLTFQMFDLRGELVYQTSAGINSLPPGMVRDALSEAVSEALEGRNFNTEVTHHKFGNKFMVMGLPLYKGASIQGAMTLTMPLASVEDTANILKKQLIIITGILFLISIAVSSVLSKSFTKPILEISQVAESYTDGDFEKRLPAFGDDEIGRLAGRMNQMGEALSRNEMLKRELISNVSHELRTPLTIIRGYAETLRDLTGDNPKKREAQLGVIITQSQRLGNIVEDILSLSKLQSGSEALKTEVFSLSEMIKEIRDMYELESEDRTFIIEGEEGNDFLVLGDRSRIEQVMHNFIGNALRHTSLGDEIKVRLSEIDGIVRTEVKDSGEGISKEDLDHVFERYYKGRLEDEKQYAGTGLGLAIVKSILDMHGSKYGVESEQGRGTNFWFELPESDYHNSF